MKILHIAPIGDHAEGIGTVIKRLYTEQIKLGNEVRIISTQVNKTYKDLQIVTIKSIKEFKTLIDDWTPNIVHFHSIFEFKYCFFSKYLIKCNIPYVVQMHGALSYQNYQKGRLKKWMANFLFFNYVLRNARSIIYLNQSEYENSIVKTVNCNYAILPNGCDASQFQDKYEFDNEKKINLIYLGRINKHHKGLDLLISALRVLAKENSVNFRISFYGNETDNDVDWLKSEIVNIPFAVYCGGIYGNNKLERIRKSDIFILTSRYEGMPMGVLESLSLGVPCIVTPGTNMADTIRKSKSGWIAGNDAECIASTIKKACKDYVRNSQYYRTNAMLASYDFKWDNIAKKSIDVYSNAIIKDSL